MVDFNVNCRTPPGAFLGDDVSCQLLDTGVVPVGVITQVFGTVFVAVIGCCEDAQMSVRCTAYAVDGHVLEDTNIFSHTTQAASYPFNHNTPVGTVRMVLTSHLAAYANQQLQCGIDGTYVSGGYCTYGTELQTGSQFVYYLTPGLIDIWLSSVGLAWMAPMFTALWFTAVNAQQLCGSGPPSMPSIDINSLPASAADALQLLAVVAWPSLCQCKAGTPAPVPYPPPHATEPTGWPTLPTFTCSDVDLCATLNQIQQQLAAIAQVMNQSFTLTTLLQRYGLPFAYIVGAHHSALSGESSFAVPRCVGFRIDVTILPDGHQVLPGNPDYIKDIGWCSVSDDSGMVQERRIARMHFEWFPPQCQLSTHFNWFLNEGCVIAVTELYAEP